MNKGFDTATVCSQIIAEKAKMEGYSFVCRYYATDSRSWKILKPAEASAISKAGLSIVAVFQDRNTSPDCFGEQQGEKNGLSAYNYAKNIIRQPASTPIYFAVDYDASDADVTGCISAYFASVKQALKGEYKVGVYGSGATCKYIKDTKGLAEFSWLSMSMGHRGSRDYLAGGTWNIHQIKNATIAGISCDADESGNLSHGGWRL